ncbi:MAG TPA: hypothetical protein VK772_14365 [Puia sp.]|nr:hypothetical protein [Puia sp.]
MAKRKTDNIITGNDPELRMCFYYSPHFDQNIWRRGSSLTGERTKTDPAFQGFRQSSSRLKEASPIAASLYRLVPEHVKQYTLYRTLTGEAIKMLKEGMEAGTITETLKKKFIEPLLEIPKKKSENRVAEESGKEGQASGMRDFTSYPRIKSGVKKMTRIRRPILLQKITGAQSAAGSFSSHDYIPISQAVSNIPASPTKESEPPKSRIKTTRGLIYLGRLPECKKLKMWLRPLDNNQH